MTSPPPELSLLVRMRRRNYFVLAALLFGVLIVHGLVSDRVQPALALVLLGWSVCVMGIGLTLGWGWIGLHQVGSFSGPLSLVFATALIHLTGGPRSPYFPMLGTLPLILPLLVPDTGMPTTLGVSGGTLGAVVLLDVLAALPLAEMLPQVSCFVLLVLVSFSGRRTYQRMRATEKQAEQARLLALEQLAQSERRRVHAELERAEVERLALVGQLASGVAHEVNNPLAYVKANLSFLKEELRGQGGPRDWDELWEVLDQTQEGVLRIQQIIQDLRGFSRESPGEVARGWPDKALQEALRLVAVRLRPLGEVSLDVSPELPAVRLGHRQLVQVLTGLLLNAAEAVERAGPGHRAVLHVKAERRGDSVWWQVEDNGPGISEAVLPHLFEPFLIPRPPGEGTGMGLALCREYVSWAGGTLQAENRAEGGARFTLLLPVDPEFSPAAKQTPPSP